MSEESKLAYPQKLDINSFPKEQKPRKRKKGFLFFRRLRRNYKNWQEERKWQKSNASKKKLNFFEKTLIFTLSPIADFLDDIRFERERKKALKDRNRPPFFERLYLMYQENKAASKQKRQLDKKIRKSLSFVLEEDKRVYSIRDEILHMKDSWKALPWDKNRELGNMLISTLIITITFSLSYLLLQLSKFVVANYYDIPSLWKSGRVIFNIPDPSSLWTYSSVVSVYIAGPIMLFIIGMIFLRLHRRTKDKASVKALFYLWGYLNLFVLFFGSFLAGTITNRGFGYIMGWLYIPKYIEIPFAMFSVLMLWAIGFSAGKKFIPFTPGYTFYSNILSQLYIKLLYIYIPVAISICFLFLIGFNSRDFTIQIIYLSSLLMLTPTLRFIPEKIE
ncbi:MAG: hypothetical protein GQ527_09370 [Bacteroidales bacterium]|nr:hypothetical protein [Bacteroidales bacterium]